MVTFQNKWQRKRNHSRGKRERKIISEHLPHVRRCMYPFDFLSWWAGHCHFLLRRTPVPKRHTNSLNVWEQESQLACTLELQRHWVPTQKLWPLAVSKGPLGILLCGQFEDHCQRVGSGNLIGLVAWKIPWTEEPGGLQSMGSLTVGHDWVTSLSLFTFMHWRRTWNPLQCSCLESPRDGGAWWAAVCGVAQSRTRLKRLSSSSSFLLLGSYSTGTQLCGHPSCINFELVSYQLVSSCWLKPLSSPTSLLLALPHLSLSHRARRKPLTGSAQARNFVKYLDNHSWQFQGPLSFHSTLIHVGNVRQTIPSKQLSWHVTQSWEPQPYLFTCWHSLEMSIANWNLCSGLARDSSRFWGFVHKCTKSISMSTPWVVQRIRDIKK